MTVKVKKWLLAMTVAATTLFCGTAVACGTDDGEKKPEPIIPPSLDSADLGTYYCDVDGTEYLITLLDNYQLAFMVKDANEIGSYAVSEEGALTFTFTDEDMGEIAATLQNNVLTFTYDDVQMRFLKKVNYTVSFEENGATELQDATVLNGKTLTAPENYEWAGHVLIGWYKEATFETPFAFGTELISGDVTLYAYWAPKAEGQEEFNVTFDYNYDGVDAETVETIGGKLYTLPQPTRDGYVFAGWWVSMYGEADKLSFAFEKGYTFTEHTTLYARWEKEDALIANVSENEISWNAVGTGTYQLTIEGPDGFETVSETLPTTSKAFDFAAAPAGDYTITVTQGDKTTTLYYKNKALAKVSLFEVVDSTLVFNEVENAETYMIHIDCGSHTHEVAINNGKATTYNFSSCDMQEGGIVFVVEAQAKGYISSTSEAYTYNKILDAVANIQLDDETQEVSWDAVPYATNYILQIKVGNETVEVDTGSKTSYSLKDYDAGEIVVNVYPKTKGYNSPAPTTATLDKKGLATPHGLQVSDMTLTWSKIQGATKYTVQFGNKEFKDVETESLTLTAEMISLVEATDYEIRIKAIGETGESLWSDTFDVRYYAMYNTIDYSKNTVAWRSVLGADGYEVMVNGGEVLSFGASDTSAKIALTQAGNNTISVRFTDGEYRSNWVEKTVFAYTLTFDTRMGEPVADQYVALGDEYTLPTASKRGYSFEAWYSAPGGAAGNATKYESGILEKAGDFVLYAFWNANSYDIIYKYEYEGCTDGKDSTVFGESGTLEEPVNADSRYVFGGWYTQAGGNGVKVTDEFGNLLANWDYAEETTLYALWYRAFDFSMNADGSYSAFRGMDVHMLKHLTIPASYMGSPVLYVDDFSFRQCKNLVSISIPDCVKNIGMTAFFGCTALEEVNIYNVTEEDDFDGLGNRIPTTYESYEGVLYKNDLEMNEKVLMLYPAAKQGAYAIPEGVNYIFGNVFANSLITEITIPSTVYELDEKTFNSCANLTKIIFTDAKSDSATLTINENAFYNLPNLETVVIPSHYVTFNNNIFYECPAFTEFVVSQANNAYVTVDGILCSKEFVILCFPMGKGAASYSIPSNITGVGEKAFANLTSLKEIVFTENVTSIGANAFYGCAALETVTFESAIAPLTIGMNAFSNLSNLSTLNFKEGSNVVEIGDNAFSGCYKLTQLTLPVSLESIGMNAFENCYGLLNVTFPNSDKALALSANAFYNCTALTEIKLSSNVASIDMGAFGGCTALATVNVDETNEHFVSIGGVVYTKDQTTLVYYPVGKTDVEYAGYPIETTAIAAGAFEGNLHLKKIIIPWTITTVGNNAFKNCAALEAVGFTERENVELTIGESAFEGCAALKYGYVENIEIGAWENVATLTLPKQLTALGNYAFKDTGLTSVSMKDTKVTAIGEGLFMQTNASALTSIELPEGLLSIGNQAFYNNAALKTIELPESLKTIGNYAFAFGYFDNGGLTAVSLPASVETVGDEAFKFSALQAVTLKANVTYGQGVFFGCQALTDLTIEEGVTEIPENTFYAAYAISSVEIPASVTSIGASAFAQTGSGQMTELTFAAGTESLEIGENAFKSQVSLSNLVLPLRLTKIYRNAFYGCNQLTSVSFATTDTDKIAQLVLIDDEAFSYCTALTSVTIPETEKPLDLGDFIFNCDNYGDSSLTTLHLPSTLNSVESKTFANLTALETIIVTEAEDAKFKAVNGILYKDNGATLLLCPAMTAGEVTIPNTVALVADGAFTSCKFITKVVFEAGNEELELQIGTAGADINSGAFTKCTGIKEIVLPERLTYIGQYAFQYALCGVTTLTIPSTVKEIGNWAFRITDNYSYETKLTTLIFAEREENGVKVSDLKTIGNYAFQNNNLVKSLTIPASVETIGNYAFSFSTSTTVSEWSPLPSQMESLTFAENSQLKTIGEYAFGANLNIAEVTIPASVTSIGASAFGNWQNLAKVTLPSSLSAWVADSYSSPFYNCSKLAEIIIPEGGTGSLYTIDNVLFNTWMDGGVEVKEIVWYPTAKTGAIYNIPAGTTRIGDGVFQNNKQLTSVTIPNTVTYIGTNAFSNCSNLSVVTFEEGGTESLRISPSVGYSGGSAFYNTALASVKIPARTTEIGQKAFAAGSEYNAKLTSVTFEENSRLDTIGNYAFEYGMFTDFNMPDSVSTLGNSVFSSCKKLKTIHLSEGLEAIGDYCFQYCISLTSITIPKNVESIGQYAFSGSQWSGTMNMTEIKFEENDEGMSALRTIGKYAFAYNVAMKTISLPETVETIGDNAFEGCSALESIKIPASVKNLPNYIFQQCTSLKEVELPAGLEKFGNDKDQYGNTVWSYGYCFNGCTSLESIVIPNTVKLIGYSAFANCSKLTSVTFEEGGTEELRIENQAFSYTKVEKVEFPARLTYLGSGSFNSCSNLKSVSFELADTELEIADQVFRYCGNLVKVDFADGLTKMGSVVFEGCSSLSEAFLPGTLKSIGASAFKDCVALTELLIPSSVEELGMTPFAGCTGLTYFEVDTGNTSFAHYDGLLFNKELTELIGYPSGKEGALQLPDTLTTTADGVFSGAKFTSFTLPAGITEVGNRFFQYCTNLVSVTLHQNVTKIGDYAFDGCSALTTIVDMPNGLTEIGQAAFQNCSSLQTVELNEGLKRIGSNAFQYSGLVSITIPSTLENNVVGTTLQKGLGDYAFNYCSSLVEVNFTKPAADATNVYSIGNSAFQSTGVRSVEIPANVRSVLTVEDYGYSKYYNFYAGVGQNAFSDCQSLTSVTFDETNAANFEGYLSIGSNAFYNAGIETLAFPAHLGNYSYEQWSSITVEEAVGMAAFRDNKNLTTVSFKNSSDPTAKISLGDEAFYQCERLSSITLPNNLEAGMPSTSYWSPEPQNVGIGSRAFYGCKALTTIDLPEGIIGIAQGTFIESGLTSIELPSTITCIGESAFNGTKITSIALPANLEMICGSAFQNSAIESIHIPAKVTAIKYNAFQNCTALESVTFDDAEYSNLVIDYNVFYGCTALKSIKLPNGLTSIESDLFNGCTNLMSVEIPDTVGYISSNAFANSGLTSVTIPSSVKQIQSNAFQNCAALTTVTFSEGLEQIQYQAFAGSGVKAMEIPSTVTSIGTNAFENCAALSSVTFAKNAEGAIANISAIDNATFAGCKALTTFEIPATVSRLGDRAFANSGLSSITLGEAVNNLGSGVFSGCPDLAAINVDAKNTAYVSVDGVLYNGDKTQIVIYPAGKTDESLTVFAEGLKTIAAGTFYGHAYLKRIELPEGLTTIGNEAFKDCKVLESVKIPESVTSMGSSVFENCVALKSVELPENITTISSSMFKGSGLTSFVCSDNVVNIDTSAFENCGALDTVTLNEGLLTIGMNAFKGSGLTTVAIPSTVTNIASNAFENCVVLESVTFTEVNGEKATLTSIQSYTFAGCSALASFEFTSGLNSIGSYAFQGSALAEANIPSTVASIGANAFENCASLATVTLNEGLNTIDSNAFKGSGIKAIELPSTVTNIYNNVFENCTALASFTFAKNAEGKIAQITVLNNSMFAGCSALAKFEIPATVTRIGDSVFKGCTLLTEVNIPEGVTQLGYYAFQESGIKNVTIPSTLQAYGFGGNLFQNCKSLERITFAKNDDGETAPINSISAWTFAGCSALKSIDLPSTVNYIYGRAFQGCTAMTSITLHSGVTVYENAFEGWTAEQTINLPFAEDSIPTSWNPMWNTGCAAQIVYAA